MVAWQMFFRPLTDQEFSGLRMGDKFIFLSPWAPRPEQPQAIAVCQCLDDMRPGNRSIHIRVLRIIQDHKSSTVKVGDEFDLTVNSLRIFY